MAISWSKWATLANPQTIDLSRPFASQNQDGRLEVFATAQGATFNIWQVAPDGGWTDGWHDKGIPQVSVSQLIAHVVGRNYGVLFQRGLWLGRKAGKFCYLREGKFSEQGWARLRRFLRMPK